MAAHAPEHAHLGDDGLDVVALGAQHLDGDLERPAARLVHLARLALPDLRHERELVAGDLARDIAKVLVPRQHRGWRLS